MSTWNDENRWACATLASVWSLVLPLPEPVAHALLKPDGLIDPALVGSKADCEFWSRAEGESQSGWPVVSIHTSDQMRAYGEACAAAAVAAEREGERHDRHC